MLVQPTNPCRYSRTRFPVRLDPRPHRCSTSGLLVSLICRWCICLFVLVPHSLPTVAINKRIYTLATNTDGLALAWRYQAHVKCMKAPVGIFWRRRLHYKMVAVVVPTQTLMTTMPTAAPTRRRRRRRQGYSRQQQWKNNNDDNKNGRLRQRRRLHFVAHL